MVQPVKNSGSKTDKAATQQAFARSADVQNLLFRYTDRLYRARSLNGVYDAALDVICEGLGCTRASILRFDAAGVMRFVAWRGLSEEYRHSVDGHSPWRPGDRDPDPICIEDIALSSEPQAIKDVIIREGIRGLAFIPLTINGGAIGKFMVYYDTPRLFTAQECELALTIARQLGFAIERDMGESAARQLAAIVDSSTDAIVSKTLDGVITSWNHGAERLFGYSAEEVIGRSGAMFFPPDKMEEEAQMLARVAAGEHIEPYETVRRCKDGRLVDISLTVAPLRDSDGVVIGASKIARDVTERRRAAERQTLLLREMAHRVKNLFAMASSLVQLSARSAGSTAELAESVVARLAALSRAHSLTMASEAEACNSEARLHALITAILEPYEGMTEAGQPRIDLDGEDGTLSAGQVTSFAFLLYELATNAAKYGALSVPKGQVRIRSRRCDKGLELDWKELGAPSGQAPGESGFGGRLIDATGAQLGGLKREWEPDGLRLTLLLKSRAAS